MLQRSWAERMGLPIVVWGEVVEGIKVVEKNRATVFEDRKEGIEILLRIRDNNYRKKNVSAVLVGISEGCSDPKYAVFVEPDFLIEINDDE